VIEDGKKRLALRPILPMRLAPARIPNLPRLNQIKILLRTIRAIIPRRPQILRIHQKPFRQPRTTPHMLRPRTRRIQPTNQRRPSRRTHRSGRPAVEVHHPLGRQPVEVGRLCIYVTITAEFRAVILRSDPENIRKFLLRRCVKRYDQAQQKKANCFHERSSATQPARSRGGWQSNRRIHLFYRDRCFCV